MQLSIIIPAKNEAFFLPDCLIKVHQAIQKWGGAAEIILIDNGSQDDTRKIAASNGCLVFEQVWGNISSLRNRGAYEAKGAFLAFLDADCLVDENWINCCLKHFENEKIAAVGTRAVPDFQNATWVEKAWFYLVSGAKRPDFVEWLGTSNIFVRSEVFKQVGGFNENLETGEDVELSYRIRENYLICLEKDVHTIHLRESKTLVDLFKRELWRGKSSLKTFKESGYAKKEFPSIFAPILNWIAIMMTLILAIARSGLIIFPMIVIVFLPFAFLLRKKVKMDSAIKVLQCYMVALVYIQARSFSFVSEVLQLIQKNFFSYPANFRGR